MLSRCEGIDIDSTAALMLLQVGFEIARQLLLLHPVALLSREGYKTIR